MLKVNGTHVHAVFQICCMGSILLLLISISYIIHLINFSNVQKLLYFRNCTMWWYVEGPLCWTGGRLNESCLTRVLATLSITWCCQDKQSMPSLLYQLHFNHFKVTISVIFISWFSWPCCFTRLPSYRSFH